MSQNIGLNARKSSLRLFANSKDADQPALIMSYAQSIQPLCYSLLLMHHIKTCSKQNFSILASLCRLVLVFPDRKPQRHVFSHPCPYDNWPFEMYTLRRIPWVLHT